MHKETATCTHEQPGVRRYHVRPNLEQQIAALKGMLLDARRKDFSTQTGFNYATDTNTQVLVRAHMCAHAGTHDTQVCFLVQARACTPTQRTHTHSHTQP